VATPHCCNAVLQGSAEFEFDATYSTEKSLRTKAAARQANDAATSANCNHASGRPSAIQSARPRWAPASGSTPCTKATPRAMIKNR